jgi:ribosome-binding protein aMBF1 (putative translation factor)
MDNYKRQRFYDHVGRNVRRHRDGAGLSIPVLAKAIGVTESVVTNAEAGHNCPLHVAAAIADELDCNLYDLVPVSEGA